MFIVESYAVAIIMCFITMICWGSWANTTKLVSNKKWEFPLFYWDYSIGLLLCSLLFAFTLGSMGEAGRSFIPDIQQASSSSLMSAILAGIIFNISNILLVASINLAGMAVAFSCGCGAGTGSGCDHHLYRQSAGRSAHSVPRCRLRCDRHYFYRDSLWSCHAGGG